MKKMKSYIWAFIDYGDTSKDVGWLEDNNNEIYEISIYVRIADEGYITYRRTMIINILKKLVGLYGNICTRCNINNN